MYKKVTGERIVAAIIDSIIVSIITSIPTGLLMFRDGFDAFIDNFFTTSVGGETTFDLGIDFYIYSGIAGIVIGVLYFAYIPYKWNGQTLGKKMMSIKAIDEFGNNPTFGKHILRAIQVWDTYVAFLALPLLFVGVTSYTIVSGLIGGGVGLLVFISLIMLLAKDDGRGIHDSMAGTYIVKSDVDMDKQFVEKTTQMGEWAEVDYDFDKTESKDKKDDWYE
jgi:uncharacterized RDD family membrane protein YckC